MQIVLSHPTSNANVRAAAYGFLESHMLSCFYTSLASFPGSVLDSIAAVGGPFAEIRRRQLKSELRPFTKLVPWREIGRLLSSRTGVHKLVEHEKGAFCVDAVYNGLDKQVASNLQGYIKVGATAVYAYEDGAEMTFKEAKQQGLRCLYDLPIGYWRAAHKLLAQEKERWPEWASTLTGFADSELKLARKDEELRLADHIFVASQFTAKTLNSYPGTLAPIEVIPYGFPPVGKVRDYSSALGSRPLKLLFVGGLSQRKGIADLFAVVETLKHHVELTVVGHKSSNSCSALDAALAKHNWIPSLPHQDVLKLMQASDVLVFPSLFEGFGLVITEAMSQGTPVITTERTAGPDLIEDGHNGWLIEAGSTQMLQAAIKNILSQPEVVRKAGLLAMETARQRPWQVYGRELAEAVLRCCNNM